MPPSPIRSSMSAAAIGVLVLGGAAVLPPATAEGGDVGTGRTGSASASAPQTLAAERNVSGIDDDALQRRIRTGSSGRQPAYLSRSLTVVAEQEGTERRENDRVSGAQPISLSDRGDARRATFRGSLDTEVPPPTTIEPNPEDDGAIPLARDLRLGAELRAVRTTGHIGDGPHGSSGSMTGDYDFYALTAPEGETLTVDVTPGAPLTPHVLLYAANGDLLVGARDMTGSGDAFISYPVRRSGTYYVAVGNFTPRDPFDPASGPTVITEGPYTIDVSLMTAEMADVDSYVLRARRGEVLGASVRGAARRLAILDSRGRTIQAAAADPGAIYPKRSPLPRGGRATVNHVVTRTGTYVLAVSDGSGAYSVDAGTFRAPGSASARPQTILLDFSGPTFDNRVFRGAFTDPGRRTVSPMRSYLSGWGLDRSDEKAVIRATVRRVRQIVKSDIPGSKVRILTSLQRPRLFGTRGVSRVIVGGSPRQAGVIDALGLSESVDPGNFATEETAIVMPGNMAEESHPLYLGPFLTRDSDRVLAVGQALGNVAGHEIGHFLGSFHTDDDDTHTSVMNTGYEFHFYAAGPDGVAGTKDDDRIAMRTAAFDLLQGALGLENTGWRTQVALR